jgi:hypothetical protein
MPRSGGVLATFTSVSEPARSFTGHFAYINAVHDCLQERDIRVSATMEVTSRGPRNAQLRLRPAPDAFADPVPGEAFLYWDEENGWSLGLRHDPATLAIVSPTFKGLGLLPDPEDVASWVVVLLTHPELTPSREDHPFRDHTVDDPEFEAQLSQYAPGG